MGTIRRLWFRLAASLRSGRADADLAREIDAHLALLEDDYRSRGFAPDQAQRAARMALGGADQVKERQRDARSFPWLEDLRRDIPYAVRSLWRTPGAAMAAILTLALGIGTTTAIFTLFDGVLLEPLPVNRPDELRVVRQLIELGGRMEKSSTSLPFALFSQLRRQSEVFSDTIAFAELRAATLGVGRRETPLRAGGVFVSDNYFTALGVSPALGRALVPGDGAGAERAAVLSHACWLREFGGDRTALGRPIQINNTAFTIVGVAPPGFFGLVMGQMSDVFLPIETLSAAQPALSSLADRATWTVQIAGRLQPGMTDALAADRLTAFRRAATPPAPGQGNWRVDTLPIETGFSDVRTRFARPLSILLGMAALLLLIACANVATLLAARASSRRPELVIRTAIGAGKGRLIRQLATESFVLALVAGVLGVVFASWATGVLFNLMPQGSTPLLLDVAIDRRVLVFAVAISILTALVAGVVPALRALGFDLAAALRDRSHGGARSAGRARPFAVIQVAMSVILVVASATFARTLHALTTIDPGFRPDGLLQVTVEPGARLIQGAALGQFYRGAYDRLRAVPGVSAVTSSQMPLLDRGRTTGTVDVAGFRPSSEEERMALMFQVGPAFFDATGMVVLRGRDFTDQDVAGAERVAAINEVAARRFFGTRDPVGSTIQSDGGYEIVAVVRSAKFNSLRDQELAVMFVPHTTVRPRPRMTLLVRAGGQSETTMSAIAAAARGGDPLMPLDITPMKVFVDRSVAQERLLAMLSIFFAAAALVLLSVSLYGVMTFWVAERSSEIGIHLALGARQSRIRWVVMRQPLWLAGLGIGIGVPAAVAASRLIDSLMFGVSPRDPVTIAAAALLILVVTMAACVAPARRAARVDPMTALRAE